MPKKPRRRIRRLPISSAFIAILATIVAAIAMTEANVNVEMGVNTVEGGVETSSLSVEAVAKPRNYITQLIFEMEHSLLDLKASDLTISKLEEMAIFIYESMSISTRNYHSVQHVFDIINHDERLETNPIAVLSACFHDCIYYHVDGGLTPVQAHLLEGSFETTAPITNDEEDDEEYQEIYKFFATKREIDVDYSNNKSMMLLQMVETIFGYTPGQHIRVTGDGLNEFLSAIVAVRMLKDHLSVEILAQIVCCIEATIPFRQANKDTGRTHMEQLYENMKKARDMYNLQLSDEELVTSVQRACLLSNSDVGNFGTTDRLWFLDNTWSLLPESNESLRNEYVYSVDHFHVALHKMYGFFGFLQPEVVFHEFQGVPAISEMENLTQECRKNLAFGRTYVGAKLVGMSLVSAFAVLTGGDAPISLFTGDLRSTQRQSGHRKSKKQKAANHLQLSGPIQAAAFLKNKHKNYHDALQPPTESLENCDTGVYEILAEGRRSESSFDTKRSPWSALLYGYLGEEGLNQILQEQTLYPMTEERAWNLLRALPLEPVRFICKSISQQAISRAEKLCEILTQLESEKR